MKKQITIILLAMFLLTSCSSNEDTYTKAEVDSLISEKMTALEDEMKENNANDINISDVENMYTNVINEVYDSVFMVEAPQDESDITSLGSACVFFEDEDYYYLFTNNHVIEGASNLKLRFYEANKNVDYYDTELVGTSVSADLAVLKLLKTDLGYEVKVCEFADYDDLEIGNIVIAIGSPIDVEYFNSVSTGIISGYDRLQYLGDVGTDNSSLMKMIQTDAPLNHGNSGGPLFNLDGKIVGINTIKITANEAEGLGFAISCDYAESVLYNIMDNGEYIPNMMGIMVDVFGVDSEDFDENLGVTSGIMITDISEDGATFNSSDLQIGDIIYNVDGFDIINIYTLKDVLFTKNKGDVLIVKYVRNNEKFITEVTLGDYGENS